MNNGRKILVLTLTLALLAGGVVAWFAFSGERADIVIGGKDFTEQSILGNLLAILIEENTGLTVERRLFLGGTMICFGGLRGGDLDAYVEYTGTGLVNILGRPPLADPDECYAVVSDVFPREYALRWLRPLGFNNTYTLTMRKAQAQRLGIATMSDLAAYLQRQAGGEAAEELTAGFNAEFLTRDDGYQALQRVYGLSFPDEPRQMDSGLMYSACEGEEVDVICAFATDGRIPAYDLQILTDDRHAFPPYFACPLLRSETLERHPELEPLLQKLAGTLTNARMAELNYQVDERQQDPADVARAFLVERGLVPAEAP